MLTPDQMLEGIYNRFGRHAGYRALHAKGTLTKGTFTAAPAAAELTKAAHMQGDPVPVTTRISNGAGDPGSPDYAPDVRGLATTFHLPDGSRTDISAQTAPRSPTRTPEEFLALLNASKPEPASLLRFPAFLATHPRVLLDLPANASALRPPESYATTAYYALHAFKWIAADGTERFVRYRWLPEAGESRLSPRAAKALGRDYLREEIAERLANGPVRFELELQIAGDGDDPDDSTRQWPPERERVIAGALELSELAGTDAEDEVLVFDPTRLSDGIEPSGDPILLFRPKAYSISVERRSG
ncbi:MAG: catalase family peroxidase [Solirubrobacterales bacterium]